MPYIVHIQNQDAHYDEDIIEGPFRSEEVAVKRAREALAYAMTLTPDPTRKLKEEPSADDLIWGFSLVPENGKEYKPNEDVDQREAGSDFLHRVVVRLLDKRGKESEADMLEGFEKEHAHYKKLVSDL